MDSGNTFSLLVAAAYADGTISDVEIQVLRRKASQFKISQQELSSLIDQARTGQLRITYPSTPKEREKRLDDLLDVICSDGRVETGERQFILRYATLLGGVPGDLNDRIRTRLDRAKATVTKVDKRPEVFTAPAPEPPAPPRTPATAPVREAPAQIGLPTKGLEDRRPAGTPTLDQRKGPIEMPGPQIGSSMTDLPPVTLQLVKQVIMFEGKAEAIEYLVRNCMNERGEAARIIDRVLAAHPDLKPSERKIRPDHR